MWPIGRPISFADFKVCLVCVIQESVKTKHPQLLYESKLYKILQGGSGFLIRK